MGKLNFFWGGGSDLYDFPRCYAEDANHELKRRARIYSLVRDQGITGWAQVADSLMSKLPGYPITNFFNRQTMVRPALLVFLRQFFVALS
jgi:hypothetical protein